MVIKCKKDPEICDLVEFTINGIPASYLEFGVTEDLCPEDNPKGCGNRQFIPDPEISIQTRRKYHIISDEELESVFDALRRELSFGKCNICGGDNA